MPSLVVDGYSRRRLRGAGIPRGGHATGPGRGIRKPLTHLMNRGGWVLLWLYVVALCFPRITPVKPSYFQQGGLSEANGTANNSSTSNGSTNVICKKAGPCVLCSMDEENKDHCRRTGYREQVNCRVPTEVDEDDIEGDGPVEGKNRAQAMQDSHPESLQNEAADQSLEPESDAKNRTKEEATEDGKGVNQKGRGGRRQSRHILAEMYNELISQAGPLNERPRKRRRHILADMHDEEGHRSEYTMFRSCIPFGDEEEKLTVWAFEGIMLATFAVAAPVVRYRRGRNSAPAGMARIPGSSWF